ncbi:MAG: tetratricopeptide repeat protein [Nitrospinota bacterium]
MRGPLLSAAARRALAGLLLLSLAACAGPEARAKELYRKGQVLFSQGDAEKALHHFRESLELTQALGLQEGSASNHHAIALVHIRRKEHRAALTHLTRALELDRAREDEASAASTLNDLARLHLILGEPRKALARYQEALAIDERLGRLVGAAIAHNNIGRIHLAQGAYGEAVQHFRASLAAFEKRRAALEEEAAAFEKEGKGKKAERARRRIQSLLDQEDVVRRNLADAEKRRRYPPLKISQ